MTTSIFLRAGLVCLITILVACHVEQNNPDHQTASSAVMIDSNNNLPNSIQALVTRAEQCKHFAGEFSGDQSVRDKEINNQMQTLGCDTLSRDIASEQQRYLDNPEIQRTLQAIIE